MKKSIVIVLVALVASVGVYAGGGKKKCCKGKAKTECCAKAKEEGAAAKEGEGKACCEKAKCQKKAE